MEHEDFGQPTKTPERGLGSDAGQRGALEDSEDVEGLTCPRSNDAQSPGLSEPSWNVKRQYGHANSLDFDRLTLSEDENESDEVGERNDVDEKGKDEKDETDGNEEEKEEFERDGSTTQRIRGPNAIPPYGCRMNSSEHDLHLNSRSDLHRGMDVKERKVDSSNESHTNLGADPNPNFSVSKVLCSQNFGLMQHGYAESLAMDSNSAFFGVEFGSAMVVSWELMAKILRCLKNIQDLHSASCVCKSWRLAALDEHQLRSWTLDDDVQPGGLKFSSSMIKMNPIVSRPSEWVNPVSHSPFASFQTPLSLKKTQENFVHTLLSSPSVANSGTKSDEAIPNWLKSRYSNSPKTPSPLKQGEKEGMMSIDLSNIVQSVVPFSKFLGEIDIRSSRITNEMLQLLFSSCPRLLIFRIQHMCCMMERRKDYPSFAEELSLTASDLAFLSFSECPGGCTFLSSHAFSKIASFCPHMKSLSFVFQHIRTSMELSQFMSSIASLVHLETLCIELRLPTFVKNELKWMEISGFNNECMSELIKGKFSSLKAFSVNYFKCTLPSFKDFVHTFQELQALDIQGPTIQCSFFILLQNLPKLLALSLSKIESFKTEPWPFLNSRFRALKRLRLGSELEFRHHKILPFHDTHAFLAIFPCLDSLHLLWGRGLEHEAHIYPFSEKAIRGFLSSDSM